MSIFYKLKKYFFHPSIEKMEQIKAEHYEDFRAELTKQIKVARQAKNPEEVEMMINQIFDHVGKLGDDAGYLSISEFDFDYMVGGGIDQQEALNFCLAVKNIEIINTGEECLGDLGDDEPQFGVEKHNFKIIFHLFNEEKVKIDYFHYYHDKYEFMYGIGIDANINKVKSEYSITTTNSVELEPSTASA